jgi:nicotinamide mononucleotide (NMN) deamidase PncC
MAISACKQTNSDFGIATSGVAGPESHGGKPPGTAWIAIASPGKTYTKDIDWPGSREMVTARVKKTALQFFWSVLKATS